MSLYAKKYALSPSIPYDRIYICSKVRSGSRLWRHNRLISRWWHYWFIFFKLHFLILKIQTVPRSMALEWIYLTRREIISTKEQYSQWFFRFLIGVSDWCLQDGALWQSDHEPIRDRLLITYQIPSFARLFYIIITIFLRKNIYGIFQSLELCILIEAGF